MFETFFTPNPSVEATVKRTVSFFRDRILKHLMSGDNVLIAAHGNSLRALIKHLEKLSEAAIVTTHSAQS